MSGAAPVIEVEPADSYAPAGHDHTPGDITGLDDYLSSVVGGLLVEGPGIDLTQDSITGAITIEATGGSGALEVLDEGVSLDSVTGVIDFVGAGVTATTITGGVQVSIPGGGGLDVLDEGSTIGGAFATLDFVGAGVSVTDAGGGVAEVSIPGAGAGGWVVTKKLADEAKLSNTAAGADTELFATLASGKTYAFRLRAFMSGHATPDYKIGMDYTGTYSSAYSFQLNQTFGAPISSDNTFTLTVQTLQPVNAGTQTTTGTAVIFYDGIITTTSAGDLRFLWSQNTSDGTNPVTVRKGSYIEVMEIA